MAEGTHTLYSCSKPCLVWHAGVRGTLLAGQEVTFITKQDQDLPAQHQNFLVGVHGHGPGSMSVICPWLGSAASSLGLQGCYCLFSDLNAKSVPEQCCFQALPLIPGRKAGKFPTV